MDDKAIDAMPCRPDIVGVVSLVFLRKRVCVDRSFEISVRYEAHGGLMGTNHQSRLECENMQREAWISLKVYLADLALKEAEQIARDSMTDTERRRLFAEFTERLGAGS